LLAFLLKLEQYILQQVENFYAESDIMPRNYRTSRLYAIHSNLSPNLSPTRREALRLTPLPYKGRGWGLGLLLDSTANRYNSEAG
jgi:hypothetical protein